MLLSRWTLTLAALGMFAGPDMLHAQTTADVTADAKLLEAAGVKTDGPALVQYLRSLVPTAENEATLAPLVAQMGDRTYQVREKATAAVIALGPVALPGLRKATKDSDAETKRRAVYCIEKIEEKFAPSTATAAVRLLGVKRPQGATAVLIDYLPLGPLTAADDILEALDALAGPPTQADAVLFTLLGMGRGPKLEPVVITALESADPDRRAAAALLVGRYGGADLRNKVERLLSDDLPTVRLRAAQGLILAGQRKALSTMVDLLGKAPLPLAREAEEALMIAAGDSGPKELLDNDAKSRAVCHRAWEAWWGQHKDTLVLARADLGVPFTQAVQRARRVAHQFMDALNKHDLKTVLSLVDVPFAVDEWSSFTDRRQVEEIFQDALREPSAPFSVRFGRVMRLDEFLKQGRAVPEDFLKRVDKSQVRAVYYEGVDQNGRKQTSAILVRTIGGQTRVVGITAVEEGKK